MPAGAATVAGGAGTLFLAAAVMGGAFIYDMGAVSIRVQGKKPGGENIRLILPAAVAPVGVWLVPKKELREAAREAGPYMPAVMAAADELARCPDFTLVEVNSPHEKVRIAKQGGHLVIDVDDANETVHVSVPLDAARLVAAQLAGMSSEEAREAAPPSSASL
jgi:hypothetical protein